MTAKDLNLSLDQALLQSRAKNNRTSDARLTAIRESAARPSTNKPDARSGMADNAKLRGAVVPQKKMARIPTPEWASSPAADAKASRISAQNSSKITPVSGYAAMSRSARRQGILVGAIVLANMLFLVLAGLWLTGTDYRGLLAPTSIVTATNNELPQLQTMLADIKHRLAAMEQSLVTLQSATAPTTTPEEAEQPAPASPEPVPQVATADPAPSPPPVEVPPVWEVNLGDFDTRAEAITSHQQIQALDLEPVISRHRRNGRNLYQVHLTGFSDRQAAEQAANKIMQETSLNGLWVARAAPEPPQ